MRRWLAAVSTLIIASCGGGTTTTERVTRTRDALSQAGETQILSDSNALRSQVALGTLSGQPAAANMTALTWDDDLASVADAFVANCVFGHNANRTAQYDALGHTDDVGENVASVPSAQGELSALTQSLGLWSGENTSYTYSAITSTSTDLHYTQMVWAGTGRIGCGIASCSGQFIVACDYAPGGNVLGEFPYLSGAAGTQCPNTAPYLDSATGFCTDVAPSTSTAGSTSGSSSGTSSATTGDSSSSAGSSSTTAGDSSSSTGSTSSGGSSGSDSTATSGSSGATATNTGSSGTSTASSSTSSASSTGTSTASSSSASSTGTSTGSSSASSTGSTTSSTSSTTGTAASSTTGTAASTGGSTASSGTSGSAGGGCGSSPIDASLLGLLAVLGTLRRRRVGV